jgi:hypothetical protein
MPNKALKTRSYKIPNRIVNRIEQMINKINPSNDQAKGLQRAKNMVSSRRLSYLQMNKLKHFFETYKGDGMDDEFKLLGGDMTKKWLPNSDLEQEKDSEAKIKDAQMAADRKNTHIRPHTKNKDNADPTDAKGGTIDINKSMDSRGIMTGDAIYKSSKNKDTTRVNAGYKKEIGSMLYLIEYMNKN